MRTLKVYSIGKTELLKEYQIKSSTLSANRCRELLSILYPHFKAEKSTLIFECDGYTWVQEINRKGTTLYC